MYPTAPTVTDWRRAAAENARTAGTEVPYWYDGTDATLQRLGTDLPSVKAAVLWFQNRYAVDNPALFPQNIVDASKAWLSRNPAPTAYAQGYAKDNYSVLAMTGDFLSAAATEAKELTVDGITSAKVILGIDPNLPPEPKKTGGLSFATVALLGVALGAGVYFLNKKAA